MSKKLKYIIYITLIALIFIIVADVNSRYSNIAKDKTSEAETTNEIQQRQERMEISPQNNDLLNNQNNINNVSDNQMIPAQINEPDMATKETSQSEDKSSIPMTQTREKNFYIKSSLFDTINTGENTENIFRKGEWLLASTPTEGTKIYYVLVKGNKIIWTKSVVSADNLPLKSEDVEIESDKVELSYPNQDGEQDKVVFSTDPKSQIFILPSKNETLYFKNNTLANNFKLIKKFTVDDGIQECAIIAESKLVQTGNLYNKYYIYNIINGILYKNSYLFEDYTKPNPSETPIIEVDSESDFTTIEYKGGRSFKKRISTSLLKKTNYQHKEAAPLTFEYKYKVENINTGVTISPK